jgi:tetratricopeptide (TPR) repeat protein
MLLQALCGQINPCKSAFISVYSRLIQKNIIADYNDHPNIAKALFQIAEEHYYARNYEGAIGLLELIQNKHAESVFPSREEVPFVLATCCKLSQQWDKAIANYKRTVEQYPTSRYASWSPFNIGWIYMHRKDDYDNAILWFGKQIELYPEDPYAAEALFQTECIYVHRLQDYEKGAETCLKYLENYPNELDARPSRSNLARCYRNLGETEKALEILDYLLENTVKENLRASLIKRIRDLEEGDNK